MLFVCLLVLITSANSLVAVGDEEGFIRLLETRRESPPSFQKSYLSFRPHRNAILDMTFSGDDSLLATASGDQTCHILDMSTQRATHHLYGHFSSVKQVKFQPGSNNSVIATSSRDGSIRLWDLRCTGTKGPALDLQVSLDGGSSSTQSTPQDAITYAACIKTLNQAHARPQGLHDKSRPESSGALLKPTNPQFTTTTTSSSVRSDVSVTSLSFLSASRSHVLLSGSEAQATVRLWDLRVTQSSRRKVALPLSTTRQPNAHRLYRQFGMTSMVLSADSTRLYTLCKDNSIYVYSTSHLILGSSHILDEDFGRRVHRFAPESEGLGPIYSFRHPKMKISTFYVKLALRHAKNDQAELLAAGSTTACSVVFPTNERHLRYPPNDGKRIDNIPIYQHGMALIRGHEKEVTGVAWTSEGNLISLSDDARCRVWRPDRERARSLRSAGETEGRRWQQGWADGASELDSED